MRSVLIVLGVIGLLALVGAAVAIWIGRCFPSPAANRAFPPHVVANRDTARAEALRRVASRQERNG